MNKLMHINKVPFTTYNAQLSIIDMTGRTLGYNLSKRYEGGVFLKPIYDPDKYDKLCFRMSFPGQNPNGVESEMRPEVLRLSQNGERMEICFADSHTLRFHGVCNGFSLRMDKEFIGQFNTALINDKTHIEVNVCSLKAMLYAKAGSFSLDSPWNHNTQSGEYIDITVFPDSNGTVDFCYEEILSGWTERQDPRDFAQCVADRKAAFERYCEKLPKTSVAAYKDAFELADYMSWAYVIKDTGWVKNGREALYISKNWMAWLASWDNLFHFLSLYETNPELAMDQLRCLVDYQTEEGAFPDVYNTGTVVRAFVKPPVFGAIMNVLMDNGLVFRDEHAAEVYQPMVKLAGFWTKFRDGDGDGISQYNHGNDSGADNATVFDRAPNVEGADLQTYLIELFRFLARIARQLGKREEATAWEEKSKAHLERFLRHSYDREKKRFTSPIVGTHEKAESDCLLDFIPILISDRLPREIVQSLVSALKEEGRFATACGFATESMSSPEYREDRYFRGSEWAPLDFFILSGLLRCGEREYALKKIKNYCDRCCSEGFAECYHAKTGAAQRDTAYTWSANVFQYFVKHFLEA